MQRGDRRKANLTDQTQNASALSLDVTKKLQLDLPYTFRYAAADGCGAAAMGKVDKKAGTATSSALIFFVNSI